MRENELQLFLFIQFQRKERKNSRILRQLCIKPEFKVALNKLMYDPLKVRVVYMSSGAPRLFDEVQDGVSDPIHSADRFRIK